MIKVIRENVVLRIDDTKLQEYLDMGYSQMGENGVIVKKGEAKSDSPLVKELRKKIKALELENEALRKPLETPTVPAKTTK